MHKNCKTKEVKEISVDPRKNASRMPLCMRSPNNRVVTYTGGSLEKNGAGRNKLEIT